MRARYARAIRGGIVCARDSNMGKLGMQGWLLTRDGALALRAFARETDRIRNRLIAQMQDGNLVSATLWRNHNWLAERVGGGDRG